MEGEDGRQCPCEQYSVWGGAVGGKCLPELAQPLGQIAVNSPVQMRSGDLSRATSM